MHWGSLHAYARAFVPHAQARTNVHLGSMHRHTTGKVGHTHTNTGWRKACSVWVGGESRHMSGRARSAGLCVLACACVRVCVFMYMSVQGWACVSGHAYENVYMCVCECVRVYACVRVYVNFCMSKHACACECMCLHAHMCKCTCMCNLLPHLAQHGALHTPLDHTCCQHALVILQVHVHDGRGDLFGCGRAWWARRCA